MSRRGSSGSGGGWILVVLVLAVISLIIKYIVAIAIAVGVIAVCWFAMWVIDRQVKARRVRQAGALAAQNALVSRAMRQHEAVLRGDPHGIYGAYLPVVFPEFGPGAMKVERRLARGFAVHPQAEGRSADGGSADGRSAGFAPARPLRRAVEPKGLPVQRTARPPGRRPAPDRRAQ